MSRPADARVEALRRCALFAGLDRVLLTTLAECCTPREEPAGKLLFAKGDPPDGLYLTVSGLIRVWLSGADGHALTLGLIGPHETVGEMALFDTAPRSANATTLAPSRFLFLEAGDFAHAMDQEPSIARHLLVLLAARLRGTNEALMDIAFLPLRARLCRKLLELATTHAAPQPPGAVFERVFSLDDLAQMLGVEREDVTRQLTALREDGLLRFAGRRIVIPDLSRLRAVVAPA